MALSPTSRAALMDIARSAIHARLSPGSADQLPTIPEGASDLLEPAGCFVTLHELHTKRLRGCVGRIDPEKPLWQAVYLTAGDVLGDPRFTSERLTAADEKYLELELSVLSPPHAAASPLDFDPMDDGIYLVVGNRAGFFLPQVARETGWTREQLLSRLCTEKLGLTPDTWQRPGATLYTFKVEVVGPEPFVPAAS